MAGHFEKDIFFGGADRTPKHGGDLVGSVDTRTHTHTQILCV